jgi:hypothetical protein
VQGFNFIVGRLLKMCQNEEKIFWVFVQIIENILPVNYFSEMAGLMIDVDILMCLLQLYYPDLIDYMEENFFIDYFKNLIFQWFISIYIQNFSFEASLAIWDIVFLDSSIVLFKAIIGMLRLIKDDIMKITSLEAFKNNLKHYFSNFRDIPFLHKTLLLKRFEFNIDSINKNRAFLETPMIDRINSINKYKIIKLKNEVSITTSDCYEDWPICIYDSETPYQVVNFMVYKLGTDFEIIDDYLDNSTKSKKVKKRKNIKYANLLIERKIHRCGKKLKIAEKEYSDDDSNNLSTIDDNRSEKEKNLSDVEITSDYSKDDIIINSGSKMSKLY